MKKTQQGFTLIELMIVVAIIGILAAIAIPAYQDYTIRAQVSEGLSLADGAKTAIAEYYSQNGTFPTANASAGLATAGSIIGNYVSSVNVGTNTGVITVTYGEKANTKISSKVLALSAVTNSGSISWVCGSTAKGTTVDSKYRPSSCR
ncbi:MAG: pilin [Solimonas sp.]